LDLGALNDTLNRIYASWPEWVRADWSRLLGVAVVVLVIAVLAFRRVRRSREAERLSFGRTPGRSGSASRQSGLPSTLDALASIGEDRAADRTIDTYVLRPTVGLRLVSLGLSGVVLWFIWGWQPDSDGLRMIKSDAINVVLSLMVAWAAFNVMTYEARVNDVSLIAKKNYMFTREYFWKDLVHFSKDAGYEYVLHFEPGGKIGVLRHLSGIDHLRRIAARHLKM
jgi:hypothetical protein